MSVDLLLLPLALWLSFSLRLGEFYRPDDNIVYLFLVAPLIAFPIFIRFGLYHAIVRYIGFLAMWAVIKAVSLYTLTWGVLVLLSATPGVPRSVLLINWLMAILFIGGSRAIARWWLSGNFSEEPKQKPQNRVVIYGAGRAGIQIAGALRSSSNFKPTAFIDDNLALQGSFIEGLRVYSFAQLGPIVEDLSVTEVLIAMPSASRARRSEIIGLLEPLSVHVTVLPGMDDLASGKVKTEDIREVGIRDLLGREPIEPNTELLNANIKDKVVLVTGAGGSIGAEMCRQIIRIKPAALILYERSEFDLYRIEQELIEMVAGSDPKIELKNCVITPILASILNQERMEQVCTTFGVHTIYHTAAYKHVPMVEKNPSEAIRNNVLGTYRTAVAAMDSGVETFVLISTDKAVRPTSTMGATKRFAEMILQSFAENSRIETRFTMVRFGNVLGSSGSVVPLFRKQIKMGGPVTVTDPKVTRYFMTIPEAAQLVIQAGAMGRGGDVFVLDMGEPVRVLDMAKRMINLSGLRLISDTNPDGDIGIVYTGLRPGEKLYEELLIGDNVKATRHPLILTSDEEGLDQATIDSYIAQFETAVTSHDVEKSRALLIESVCGYSPQCEVADLVRERKQLASDGAKVVRIPRKLSG